MPLSSASLVLGPAAMLVALAAPIAAPILVIAAATRALGDRLAVRRRSSWVSGRDRKSREKSVDREWSA
jgi:hypothetical protein